MLSPITAEILLVEDNASDAELVMIAMKRRQVPGDVVHVTDGDQIMDAILEASLYANWNEIKIPKVILLDLQLQNANGLDVLRQLKADERARTIPVVVFTASRREIEVVESYHLGVNSYVLKPTEVEEFIQVVGDIGHYWLNVNQAIPH